MTDSQLHIFGIRHHGPGSARSLRRALEDLKPDAILVEGPPDAVAVLPLLAHAAMQPPVALLIYRPDDPKHAVYYPFAVFSPEWQAIHYGLSNAIPVRFMDLPQTHQLATPELEPDIAALPTPPEDTAPDSPIAMPPSAIRRDPIGALARAAGYPDGERWWEHMVEHRRDGADLFAGILDAMAALRDAAESEASSLSPQSSALSPEREAQREAWMRQTIREAQREGFERIAIVCGAWHAPVLADMPPAKNDAATLKGLPKVKVAATWVPWTHGRLCYASGYGAGVESPGWYHHLWTCPDRVVIRWMARVAGLLREEGLDASSASVIEAVRLAETLAALRDRPLPGLPELNEATQTVLCFGSDLPLQLIGRKLIVGEALGAVPDETPMVPLQQDLLREQKRLRLNAEADQKALDLDLRKPHDLERSCLLHRLTLLGIPWGKAARASGKGTFREAWTLQWQPDFAIALIEAGIWGNTVAEAATARTRDAADKSERLPELTELLARVRLADLPGAAAHVMARLQDEAALTGDTTHLMQALPPLAEMLRYGDVRQTDTGVVAHIVDGLVARICIGLPGACASLNDEAAGAMLDHIGRVHSAVALLQNDAHLAAWHGVLRQLAEQNGLHGLIAGRSCRLLLDAGAWDNAAAAQHMSLALSPANEPAQSAAWVEGFLQGSGLLLLHDEALWQVLDAWVTGLTGDIFTQLLPLLRRTFANFPAPERRQMGERVKRGFRVQASGLGDQATPDFDPARAAAVLPLVGRLLGLEVKG